MATIFVLTSVFITQCLGDTSTSLDIIEIPTLPSELVEYVHNDNKNRIKNVENTFVDIMKRFENDKYQPISSLTYGMTSGALDLANARSDLRENLVYAVIMPQFKPSDITNPKQKQLWDAIDDGVIQIYNAAFSVMSADSEFQGNFYRTYSAIQTALSNMNHGLDYDLAINVVKTQLTEWEAMQSKFEIAIDKLSDDTIQTLSNIIRNTIGANEMQTKLKNVKTYYHKYTHEFDELQSLEDERMKIIQPLRNKLAEKKVRFEVADFEFKNAQSSADNRDARNKHIETTMDNLYDNYSKLDAEIEVTKYRTETTTSGWWLWKRTKTRQVAYKDRITNPARTRVKERIDIWSANKKEVEKGLKTVEDKKSKWKEVKENAKEEVVVDEKELDDIEQIWRDKIAKQAKKVELTKRKWDETNTKLQKMFEETGVDDDNIVEFLKMAQQFPEQAIRTYQASKGMNEFIKSFYGFLEQRVGSDDRQQSIEEYFTSLGAQNNYQRIFTAMSNQGMNNMVDLEIEDIPEYEEMVKAINEELESHSEEQLKFGEKRFLSKVIKGKLKTRRAQSKVFKDEFPLIMDYFQDMSGGINNLKKELPFFSNRERSEYIAIGKEAKQEL